MKIRPLNDRVVVKINEKEEVSEGGIVIPDSAKERPNTGTVVATGTGRIIDGQQMPPVVKLDDVVLFEDWAGKEYKSGEESFRILREDEILGVVEED